MEHTFITIHDLSEQANILFISDSVTDILGWQPQQVRGRSCFDYFHEDERFRARTIHRRGVVMDKAAVLHYARIRSDTGAYVTCECCFTIVHDVLVACTSIYRRSANSEKRAVDAPEIRRIFSSSARDPRYGMLEHLSSKFTMPSAEHEPRAALILNRFTRTLSVMYSTPAISSILGIDPEDMQHRSFYECIAPNCLPGAVRCLESAKANDSIAYLRFWFQDPRHDVNPHDNRDGTSATMDDGSSSTSDDSDGGAPIDDPMEVDMSTVHEPSGHTPHHQHNSRRRRLPQIELEAVISCTSDGLVVILRRARPIMPTLQLPQAHVPYQNGLFAAPWGAEPIHPQDPPPMYTGYNPGFASNHGAAAGELSVGGHPPMNSFMQSIRDVAVFAWALIGINDKLAEYSHGVPSGEAQPEGYSSASTDRSRSDYWSHGSSDDALVRPSDLSPMTPQHLSNACSNEPSPYMSDGSSMGPAAPAFVHSGVHEASSHPLPSLSEPPQQYANHGGHRTQWSDGSSTITSLHQASGTETGMWHGSSNSNQILQHHSDELAPAQPTTTTGPPPTHPAE